MTPSPNPPIQDSMAPLLEAVLLSALEPVMDEVVRCQQQLQQVNQRLKALEERDGGKLSMMLLERIKTTRSLEYQEIHQLKEVVAASLRHNPALQLQGALTKLLDAYERQNRLIEQQTRQQKQLCEALESLSKQLMPNSPA